GVHVEPTDAEKPRQIFRQGIEDGRPALRIVARRHQLARLVIEEEPCALALRQRLAVDRDAILRRPLAGGRGDGLAAGRHAPGRDPGFRLTARAEARARHHLGNALTGGGTGSVLAHRHLGHRHTWLHAGHPRLASWCIKAWMAGTSPAMTMRDRCRRPRSWISRWNRRASPRRRARCRSAARSCATAW